MTTSTILSVVGGVAGFALGGPTGALVGQGLASVIARPAAAKLDPTINESPRLTDLSIQTAEYGVPIKKVYGRQRIAGNVIWGRETRIERIESREAAQSNRKGSAQSPDTINIHYNYYQSFLVSICQGPIGGILRIWADRELIYNLHTQDVDTITQSQKLPIHIALGTQTQLPFSLIEGYEGKGKVPAYRGQALVLFQDWLTNAYGGRIPNLEFEILA
jgi:hypothetical protein